MKIKNPKQEATEKTKVDKHRAAILAFITASEAAAIDFADVRASFPVGQRAEVTDGVIHQACIDAGLTVAM